MTTPAPRRPCRSTRTGKYARDGGFTLAETMVSLALLAIVAGGATTAVVGGTRAQRDTQDRVVAVNLASADLDRARAVEFPFQPSPTSTVTPVGGTSYTVSRTIVAYGTGTATATPNACPSQVSPTTATHLLVRSKVVWRGGPTAGITMSTVIAC